MRSPTILAALIALAACNSQPAPGGASAGEAKALDDAAEMLEARRLPEEALRPPAVQQSPGQPPATQPATPGAAKK